MKNLHRMGIFAFIIFSICLTVGHAEWVATGVLNSTRYDHTQTVLKDGRILVAGGRFNNIALSSAEIYDPATGQWTTTGSLNGRRFQHTATLLSDGRVLVAGGAIDSTSGSYYEPSIEYIKSAEIFDPSTGLWTTTDSLEQARCWHSATLMNDGKVIVVGGRNGYNYNGVIFAHICEVYDPASGFWTNTPTQGPQTYFHTATLIPDGRLLIIGGMNTLGGGSTTTMKSSASIYNPQNGVWSTTGSMNFNRAGHCAILLANGKVFVAGGSGSAGVQTTKSYEIFDTISGTWTPVVETAYAMGRSAITLSDGKIFFINCVFNPVTGIFSPVDNMIFGYHGGFPGVSLLQNGKVLVTASYSGAAELFVSSPPIIIGQPTNASALQGRSLSLAVVTPGDMGISYQWRRNGIDINGATSATLKLTNIQPGVAGEYSVTVKNSVGVTSSNVAIITVIPDSDEDGISDANEVGVYHTDPNDSDTDDDGLSDYLEIHTHATNPLSKDSDGDGYHDAYEVQTGKSPSNPADKPILVAEAHTAIEFSFPSAVGKTYRIEGSVDLQTWSTVENGITGTGSGITRFYSTRNASARFFRVEESVNP